MRAQGGPFPRRLTFVVSACLAVSVLGVPLHGHADSTPGAVMVIRGQSYYPGGAFVGASRADVPVVVGQGFDLLVENIDLAANHTVTSDDGLFDSGSVEIHGSGVVELSQLPPGSYGFHCDVHPGGMWGTIVVV